MTGNDKAVEPSSVDKIIERIQIAGRDFFTEHERLQALEELAQLYTISRTVYQRRRNELQVWFGSDRPAIDADVLAYIDQHKQLAALPKPDDDPVSELVAIGKREMLWRYNRVAYVTFQRDGHFENHQVDSDDFEDFLSDEYAKTHECQINDKIEPRYPEQEDLRKAIRTIQAYARRGPEKEPRIRITAHQGELWIDLGTPDWSAVVVNAKGWRIEPIMRAPLIRGGGMRPLPIPDPDQPRDIQELRQFVNVRDDAEDEFALLCGGTARLSHQDRVRLSSPPGLHCNSLPALWPRQS